jgi:hypothetical protein
LELTAKPTGEPKVWIYVVDGRQSSDLAILDTTGLDEWRANKNTCQGDLILMYRTRPFSDIAYVFVAGSDPYETEVTRYWQWKYGIRITGGFRLPRVITLNELRLDRALDGWSFVEHQQGIMDRTDDLVAEGVWDRMREILEERGADLPRQFGSGWARRSAPRKVFLSYVRENERRANELRSALAANRIDVWYDKRTLRAGQNFHKVIRKAMNRSKVVIICLSKAWTRGRGYARKELKHAMRLAKDRKDFILPVKLENCPEPRALKRAQVHYASLYGRSRQSELNTLVYRLARELG